MSGIYGIGNVDPLMAHIASDILRAAMMQSQGVIMQAPMGYGFDGFNPSAALFDRARGGGIPQFGYPFAGQNIGLNGGIGIPGFGGFGYGGNQMQQMMQMMLPMLMMMMMMMQRMGIGQQNPYGQQKNPFQQQPISPFQQQGQISPFGQPGGQGSQTFEMKKNSKFTTPGGCTIDWHGDTVKVHEPGGGQRDLANGFAAAAASVDRYGNANAAAAAWGDAEAAAAAAGPRGSASAAAVSGDKNRKADKARNWKVWGDPHIQNPDGTKHDFKQKNALFTLQDGTKVLMMADNPKGVVERVRITLPGGTMNLQGVDPSKTSVYMNDGQKLHERGTLDQYINQFQSQNNGWNISPYGNQLCPFCPQQFRV